MLTLVVVHVALVFAGHYKSDYTKLMQGYDPYKYTTGVSGAGVCPDTGKPTLDNDVWEQLMASKPKHRSKITAIREHGFPRAAVWCLIAGMCFAFRSRAEFLDLQQGKHDVHAYSRRARNLVSNIVTDPIYEATKVVTFMKGLKDGPVKTYLSSLRLRFLCKKSLDCDRHVNVPRPMPRPMVKPSGDPKPMDLSSATATGSQQQRGPTNVCCFRCGNNGHYAREWTAPVQATKGPRNDTGYRHGQ
ncbi:hypothetical protein PF010_g26411 [Phytophthora fragariae]|uniref:CCHC-type domain-containing protein n=1 Tax=Phytophthora fragariae TaxID=53985 RepID=A0A6G0JXU8_9STRA|nr:hypothetical protein PF010_g26411 [Phytophthora fragariae]